MTQEVKSFHTTRALPFIFTQKMRSKTPLRKPLTGGIFFFNRAVPLLISYASHLQTLGGMEELQAEM